MSESEGSMSESEEPVEVDVDQLSPEALRGLAESFVAREGTDYGLHEASWEDKVAQVLRQLENGEARVVYDEKSESVTLIPRR